MHIYNDKYGLNSVRKLIPWVIATDGKGEERDAAISFLLKHFED